MNVKKFSIILLFILLWFLNPILSALLILVISCVYPFKPLILLLGLLLSIPFGFISYSMDLVGDFLNYKENITSVINNGLDLSIRGGEFGYYLIVFILGYIFNNSIEVTHVSMLILANIIFFIALFNINYRFSIFIFLLLQFFSVLVINPYLSRQFLAVALILFGISINKRGKWTFSLMSIFVHFSSLIYIMILLIPRRILNSKKCFLILSLVGLFLFVTMNLEILKIIVSQKFLPEFINVKAGFYLRMEDSKNKVDIIALVFCVYTFYLKYKMLNISCSKIEENIINLFFISAILCFSFIHLPVLPTRVGFLTYYLSPLLLIFAWKSNKVNLLNIVNTLFLVFCILIAIYKIYLNDFSVPWVLLSDGEILNHDFLYYINRL